jgi:threonine/homoserine/homoserine lactone efflux protein
MEVVGLFVTAIIVGLSGAMMPGPLLTVTIGETARHGIIAAPLIILGHIALELLLVGALMMGLARFLNSTASQWMAIFGGIFMLWMGWGMIRDVFGGRVSFPPTRDLAEEGVAELEPAVVVNNESGWIRFRLILTGIFVSLANPYWILWWATVGLGYVTLAAGLGTIGIASFFTGHAFSDIAWYIMIGAVVSGGRKFLNEAVYRGVLVACGVFLFGMGGYFIHYGVFNS